MGANILYVRVGDGAVRRKFCWTRRRSEGDRWSGGEGGIVHARFPANRPSVRPYVSTQARTHGKDNNPFCGGARGVVTRRREAGRLRRSEQPCAPLSTLSDTAADLRRHELATNTTVIL